MAQTWTLLAATTMLVMAPLSANAHMIMKNPVPYQSTTSSNLDPDLGFPCQAVPYTITSMNNWPAGSTQTLEFGDPHTAVHAGGSCQISVTTDRKPTKGSKWKVIHSMEGGCPASAPGNLEGGQLPSTFSFTVPKDLPNGEMAMAWTWFNKKGNREMYMNCAPIKVTGGSDSSAALDALPDMAIANIKGTSCKTNEDFDYSFADPGKSTVKGGTGPFQPLCGSSGNAVIPGPDPAPAPAPKQPSSKPDTPSVGPKVSAATSTTRTIITVTAPMYQTQAPAPSAKQPASQPASQPAPQPAPQSSKASAQNPAPSGDASKGTPCSPDGAIICQGDTMFALCNHGLAVFRPVSRGTTCKNGAVARRSYHAHQHVRKHF